MSSMKDIALLTPEQLGMTIRLKRKEKSLSQTALAELLGVERKWVLRLEAGNAKAEVGLVLKALAALGLRLSMSDNDPRNENPADSPSRLDDVFRRVQRQPRE